MIPTPSVLRAGISRGAHQLAWPPAASQPLYRAETASIQGTKRNAAPADLRLAIRLAAVTALIAVGIGLGHGVTASSASLGDSPFTPGMSLTAETSAFTTVQAAVSAAR